MLGPQKGMFDGAAPWRRSTHMTSVRALLLAFVVLLLLVHQLAGFPQRLPFTAAGPGLYTREATTKGIVLRAGHVRGPLPRRASFNVMSFHPRACRLFRGSCIALRDRADQDGAEAEGDAGREMEEDLSRPLAAGDYARVLDDAPG